MDNYVYRLDRRYLRVEHAPNCTAAQKSIARTRGDAGQEMQRCRDARDAGHGFSSPGFICLEGRGKSRRSVGLPPFLLHVNDRNKLRLIRLSHMLDPHNRRVESLQP